MDLILMRISGRGVLSLVKYLPTETTDTPSSAATSSRSLSYLIIQSANVMRG